MNAKRPVRILADIGDYILVPLPDGRITYVRYLFYHDSYTSLVQTLDLIADKEQPRESIFSALPLFPPTFVGFNDAIRQKHWRVVANRPVVDFQFPLFRCTQAITHHLEPGVFHDWLLWDGKEYTKLGDLPMRYQQLEYLVSWASDHLEERIATGRNFPFGLMR